METRYKMTLDIPAKLVTPIMELMAGEGVLVSVEQCIVVTEKPEKPSRYRNGKRNKGVDGAELVLDLVKGRGKDGIAVVTVRGTIAANGFAETSAYSYLNKLCSAGQIKKVGDKYYYVNQGV